MSKYGALWRRIRDGAMTRRVLAIYALCAASVALMAIVFSFCYEVTAIRDDRLRALLPYWIDRAIGGRRGDIGAILSAGSLMLIAVAVATAISSSPAVGRRSRLVVGVLSLMVTVMDLYLLLLPEFPHY